MRQDNLSKTCVICHKKLKKNKRGESKNHLESVVCGKPHLRELLKRRRL